MDDSRTAATRSTDEEKSCAGSASQVTFCLCVWMRVRRPPTDHESLCSWSDRGLPLLKEVIYEPDRSSMFES